MLSPYVGMSHFVWTAQIAVTLVALACGYYTGGRLADRSPKLSWLYWSIIGAAGYLALTVVICRPVAYWCLDFNLAVGSLLASTILFFVPLALLAMTGPFLVRVITSSVAGVGGNVGRLTSVSTLGSFAGTLLIGYCLIPYFPNSVTMYITALCLLLVCVGFFAMFRGAPLPALAVIAGICVAGGVGLRHELSSHLKLAVELFHGNSHFGQLQVVENSAHSRRYYLNDFLTQNTYDPATKQSVSHFTYMLAGLARVYTTNIQDVLCIGLGVGIVPMDFARQGARVDVVEINPAVVKVATEFFNLDKEKMHLTIDDGRHYLNCCSKRYDAVILDAFLGDSSPSHLLTREAFTAMRRVLKPGGCLVINLFGNLEPGRDFLAASLDKTLKAVFPGVRIHANGSGNMFFVATDRAEPRFVHAPDLEVLHPDVESDAKEAYNDIVEPEAEDGRILTDDFNPAEFYDAHNREHLRRMLANSARRM